MMEQFPSPPSPLQIYGGSKCPIAATSSRFIWPCPSNSTFFTTGMVKEAIEKLCTGRAQNHDALGAPHVTHARNIIAVCRPIWFNVQ